MTNANSKAARLAPASLRALSEAVNSALVHSCEYGHAHCALKFKGACADEAAELQHRATLKPASLATAIKEHAAAHGLNVIDLPLARVTARDMRGMPTPEPIQQPLF